MATLQPSRPASDGWWLQRRCIPLDRRRRGRILSRRGERHRGCCDAAAGAGGDGESYGSMPSPSNKEEVCDSGAREAGRPARC
jgi:hypothetical protein